MKYPRYVDSDGRRAGGTRRRFSDALEADTADRRLDCPRCGRTWIATLGSGVVPFPRDGAPDMVEKRTVDGVAVWVVVARCRKCGAVALLDSMDGRIVAVLDK